VTAGGFVVLPRDLAAWTDERDDILGGLLDWASQGPVPVEHDALRALTNRMVHETRLHTGPDSALIGNGLVVMDPELAASIALRYAGDASAALQAGDTREAAGHLANGYLAAFAIGPLNSPHVQRLT
jgi:hypothetical protein